MNVHAQGARVVVVTQYVGALRRIVRTCRVAGFEPALVACARTPLGSGRAFGELSPQARAVVSSAPRGVPVGVVDEPESLATLIDSIRPDLLVVRGFPWLIPAAAWESCRLGGVNLHPSALPRDRGPYPVQHALLRGDPSITVTAHAMAADFDAGAVLARSEVRVDGLETGDAVWSAIDGAADHALSRALAALSAGDPGLPQDESAATWAARPLAEAYRLSGADSVRTARNKVRAASLGGAGPVGPHLLHAGEAVPIVAISREPTGTAIPLTCTDGTIWLETAYPLSSAEGRI